MIISVLSDVFIEVLGGPVQKRARCLFDKVHAHMECSDASKNIVHGVKQNVSINF